MNETANKAGEIFEKLAKSMNYNIETMHLLTSKEYKRFEDRLIEEFKKNNVDISFRAETCEKYNLKLGGNAIGIANDFYWSLIKKNWIKTEMNSAEIEEHLNKHSKAKVYRNDNTGHPYEIKKKTAIEIKLKETKENIGYGSYASTLVQESKVYKDKFNNIMVINYAYYND